MAEAATTPLRAVDFAAAYEIARRLNPRKMPWIAMVISKSMEAERMAAAEVFDAAQGIRDLESRGYSSMTVGRDEYGHPLDAGGVARQRLDNALKVVRGKT